jgi:outer membrane protein assembly factor BamB
MRSVMSRGLASTVAAAALLALTAATALAGSKPPSPVPAVAYQLNAQHTGATTDSVAATPTKQWSVTFSGGVSYPLITGGLVYVTVADSSHYGTKLYALSATTGKKVWGPVALGGTYYWSGLTYASGRVFTVNFDGLMEAFNAVSGAAEWSRQLPGQYEFSSPPTAADGYVYTGGAGSGGTVYAVDQTNGVLEWTGSVENGNNSSPAVSKSGVYVSYACGQTYDFSPGAGALIWRRSTECEGGGGKTPVLANGRLYVRDFEYPAVLSAGTGKVLGPFSTSGPAPAVDSADIYDLSASTLTATSVSSGAVSWSFAGDGTLDSAPLVAAGTVFIGGSSGELYALSSSTGTVTWSTNVGAAIPAPDEQDVSAPLTGLATSGGLLVVPAGETLVAFR